MSQNTTGMKKVEEETDTRFGFVWGDNGQFQYIWSPSDGSIKKVPRELVDGLESLATGDAELDEMDTEIAEFVKRLDDSGFLYEGPVFRLSTSCC